MAKKKKKWIKWVIIAVIVLGTIADVYIMFGDKLFPETLPEGFLSSSGRIEGRLTDISSKIPGRIEEIYIEDGSIVNQGQLIATISSKEIQASLKSSEAQLRQLQSQKSQAVLDLSFTTNQTISTIKQSEAQLGVAEANLAKAKAAEAQADNDLKRSKELFESGAIPRRRLEQDTLAYDLAIKETQASEKYVIQARAAVNLANDMKLTINIKKDRLTELDQAIESAEAQVELSKTLLEETKIYSPNSGVILDQIMEIGEVVNTGSIIATLVNPDDLYMKTFIPTEGMSKLKIGDEARIYPDGLEDKWYAAIVTKISEQAEFTPKNVETKNQRTNLVFEIRLGQIDNSDRQLKTGMSAEAEIRFDESLQWAQR